MMQHDDPFMYFAGSWAEIDESLRTCLFDALKPDTDTRRLAWSSLLKGSNLKALALALDLVTQAQAASRMGRRLKFDPEYVRRAAIELLRIDGIDGRDRWGKQIPLASHIVALRTLSMAATSEDVYLVSSMHSESPRSDEWKRAWIAAVKEVIWKTPGDRVSQLIEKLISLSRNKNSAETVRREAVLAIDASRSTNVVRVLHDIYRSTSGDARIEAVAALAVRNALDEDELKFIRELFEGEDKSGVFLEREHELLAAIKRRKS
jgi:hypothetical protein